MTPDPANTRRTPLATRVTPCATAERDGERAGRGAVDPADPCSSAAPDLLAPPGAARLGERVDGVVVGVPLVQFGVLPLDGGAVVLRPVRDAVLAVVLADHVHPALADERDVAHDARGGVARQVPHDVVLHLLGVGHG